MSPTARSVAPVPLATSLSADTASMLRSSFLRDAVVPRVASRFTNQRTLSSIMSAPVNKDADKVSIWASIFGTNPKPVPAMTDPLPGVILPPEPTYPASPPATEVTTLANGVTIASENTPVRVYARAFRLRQLG